MASGDTVLLKVLGGLMVGTGLLAGVTDLAIELLLGPGHSSPLGPLMPGVTGGLVGGGVALFFMARKTEKEKPAAVVRVFPTDAPPGSAPLAGLGGSAYKECPSCGAQGATLVKFSWWGGVVGPKLLTHVECPACRTRYNGKTGGSNVTGIVVYSIVVAPIALALVGVALYVLWTMRPAR